MEEKWRKTLELVRSNSKKAFNTLACNSILLAQPYKHKSITAGMLPADPGRRQGRRLRFEEDVCILKDGMPDSTAHMVDISATGMYVETDMPLDEGQEIRLSLQRHLPLLNPVITGRVVRKASHGMALRFV